MPRIPAHLICLAMLVSGCSSEPTPGVDAMPPPPPPDGQLIINEILIGPGTQDDWIELFNAADDSVDLTGMSVRISPIAFADQQQLVLPASQSLPGGGFFVLDEALAGPGPGADEPTCARGFQLPDEPFEVRLLDAQGGTIDRVVVDQTAFASLRPGTSFGRVSALENGLALQINPTPGAVNAGSSISDPCLSPVPEGEFDSHTVSCLSSKDSFFWLAGSRAGTTVVKFEITSFPDPDERALVLLDSVFYSLHDEWYYFLMLNGVQVPGEDMYQAIPGEFETVADIQAWARAVPSLPYDTTFLSWSGDRLYSRRFYDLALRTFPRAIGAGVLTHVPARRSPPVRDEIWGFELEYADAITHADLMVYFDMLEQNLPADIAEKLVWIIRSPEQEALAQTMEAQGLPYHDRLVRYTELSVPGETRVYNSGLVAGRVRMVRAGEPGLENATTTDILILEEIPDYLPPCQALITTVPQTPLSHIALLAESRGIPNLYVGDLTNDPAWDQWGRIRAPIALHATGPDSFQARLLSSAEYDTWRALVPDNDRVVPQVDIPSSPYTLELTGQSAADMDALRPLIGGKSAGYLAMMEAPSLTAPDFPLAITVRAYSEFLQPLRAAFLDALLQMAEFRFLSHRQFRYLVLEGEDAYDRKYATPSGQIFKQGVLDSYPAGHWLGDIIRAGGVRAVIAATPIDPATLALLEDALAARFSELAPTQALRFRSSSNVEDIEGFNGAGLYQSNTGYLDPLAQPDPGDHDKTVERALLATWASYWGWEAYDERLHANVDHLSGNMGVLVHARFDDEYELANGVFTVTRFPDAQPAHAPAHFPDRYEMRLNVQAGSLSVANPPPGRCVLPEIVRARMAEGDVVPRIERVQGSSEVPSGTQILADADLLALFEQAREVTDIWLASENALAPAEQARRTVTLDFEFRIMDQGWPELASGVPFERRVIVKQVRSLEPSTADAPAEVRAMPFPEDVLARARLVNRLTCAGDRISLTAVEASTDPLASPDLGYDVAPFTAAVTLDVTADIPEIGWLAGQQIDIDHLDVASFDHPGALVQAPWSLVADIAEVRRAALDIFRFEWTPDVGWQIENDQGTATGAALACTVETLYATPDTYLLSLLAE